MYVMSMLVYLLKNLNNMISYTRLETLISNYDREIDTVR
jgi:hypothetical protein